MPIRRRVLDLLNAFKLFGIDNPVHLFIILLSLAGPVSAALYVSTFSQPIPIGDQWRTEFPVALGIKRGTFQLSDLAPVVNGSRPILTRVVTFLFTVITGWNTQAEAWFNLGLALVVWLLLIYLCWRTLGRYTIFALLPVSLLLFSLHQDVLWITSTFIETMDLLILVALLIVLSYSPGWRPLIIAALALFGATFSYANAIVCWPVFAVVLWGRGYRKWQYYAAWFAVTVVCLELYVRGSAVTFNPANRDLNSVSLNVSPFLLVAYIPVFIGDGFSLRSPVVAGIVGVVGFAWLALNVRTCLHFYHEFSKYVVGLVLIGYALGSATLIGLARLGNSSFSKATVDWYTGYSLMFWIGLTIVTALALSALQQDTTQTKWKYWTVRINTGLCAIVIILFAYTNAPQALFYGLPSRASDENCLESWPISQDWSCFNTFSVEGSSLDVLAKYRLAFYAQRFPTLSMPDGYNPQDPIFIEAGLLWQAVHIDDALALGKRANETIIVPATEKAKADEIPRQDTAVVYVSDSNDERLVANRLSNAQQVWLIIPVSGFEKLPDSTFVRTLDGSDYVPVNQYSIPDYKLQFIAFRRMPEFARTGDIARYDDVIRLRAWKFDQDINVHPCQQVSVKTWWSVGTSIDIARDFEVWIELADPTTGSGVVKAITPIVAAQIPRSQTLLIDTSLKVPCDSNAKDYMLLLSLHPYEYATKLPLTRPDGTKDPLLYLTTLKVATDG